MKTDRIKAVQGDITKLKVDAIVNAANNSLMGGGGVDGAIHRAGGPAILADCKKIIADRGSCKTGNAVITKAGNLPAHYVIHTVGPVWHGGQNRERELLAQCYRNSLHLAVENKCHSISFPNISTGVYGFPKKEAAEIAVKTVVHFMKCNDTIELVLFVCFDADNFKLISHNLAAVD